MLCQHGRLECWECSRGVIGDVHESLITGDPLYQKGLADKESELKQLREELTIKEGALQAACVDLTKADEELAARDLVIEQMREAIQYALRKDYNCNGITAATKLEASVLLQPSTDAIKARDRKRDAALLRAIALGCDESKNIYYEIRRIADLREAGEWEPELEAK